MDSRVISPFLSRSRLVFHSTVNGHDDVASGVETAIIREDKKKKKKVAMKCALFTSGIGICPEYVRCGDLEPRNWHEWKKKKSISVPVGCQSLDEQVILPSNFHRDSFDRYNSSFSSPLFVIYLFIKFICVHQFLKYWIRFFSMYLNTNLNIPSKSLENFLPLNRKEDRLK